MVRLLRQPWSVLLSRDADDWERPAPTAAQQRNDVVLALALAGAGAGSAVLAYSVGLGIAIDMPGFGESVAWSIGIALPLAARRRFPLAVLITVSALFIGLQARGVPEQQLSSVTLFLALFTAGAWGRDRQVTRVVRIGVVVVMFAWLAYALSATAWSQANYPHARGPLPPITAQMIYVTAINVLYFAAAVVFGTMAWNQARQAALLEQRNAELAVERDANAERAVVAERLRIARELHDVVAHHVSLMGIQAAAARRMLDHDPALTRSTLESVEQSGRSAVDDMQRLLGVLRSGRPAENGSPEPRNGSLEPAPGLDQVVELVERTVQAGLRADLTVVGLPVQIPTSVSICAYRIVQEALTNTVRHAGARRVDVRIRYLAGAVEVEVVDDGRGWSARAGGGLGHVGMRERVSVHDGLLEVGPRTEGGYRVRARLPVPVRAPVAP